MCRILELVPRLRSPQGPKVEGPNRAENRPRFQNLCPATRARMRQNLLGEGCLSFHGTLRKGVWLLGLNGGISRQV
ncbi:hypothetical protein EYR41_009103 [Orbilia oligospora]|uniref:Uncharacterized protein n=1 Tax=Orbilia oligospora TaxID=2813651 RepID=A0A7C8P223_ORBOL|nr:hypothetical protein TWF751_000555 [Orbilia oligospora]TGJ65104.1 hypothetical protein EYR41_009103 [Orbilia oligospora]